MNVSEKKTDSSWKTQCLPTQTNISLFSSKQSTKNDFTEITKPAKKSRHTLAPLQGDSQTVFNPSTTSRIMTNPQVSGATTNSIFVLPQNSGHQTIQCEDKTFELSDLYSHSDNFIHQEDIKRSKKRNEMRCRTCLDIVPNQLEQASISMLCFEGISVKEGLVQLVPEMNSTLADDQFVCPICFLVLRKTLKFVKQCQKSEKILAVSNNIVKDDTHKLKEEVTNTELDRSELKTKLNNFEKTCYKEDFHCDEYEFDDDINFDEDDVSDEDGSLFEFDPKVEEQDYVLNGIADLLRTDEDKKSSNFHRKSDLFNGVMKHVNFLPLEYANVRDHDSIVSIANLQPDFIYSLQRSKVRLIESCSKFDENIFENKRVLLLGNYTEIKCLLCEEHFITEEKMQAHLEVAHGLSKAFLMEAHCYHHIPGSTNVCKACGKDFGSEEIKKVHSITCFLFPCPYCDEMMTPLELSSHTSNKHLDSNPFKCLYCRQEHDNFMKFTSHLCYGILCETCGKHFVAKNSFLLHKEECPSREVIKKCIECKKRFSLSSFQNHVKTHELPCSICGKMCPNRTVLCSHEYNHQKKGSLCPLCGKVFSHLAQHMNVHKEIKNKKVKCSLCPKSFISKTRLERHEQSYHMTTRIVCERCHKIFTEYTIESHYDLEHPNETEFKCAKCDSSFTNIVLFKHHAKWHDLENRKELKRNIMRKRPKKRRGRNPGKSMLLLCEHSATNIFV
ncbi:uncharacterized protein isoform X2 [Leptinotarsa decemlineata]|uniref:uncharacterized protein isoform X2 n=1 Tax=Leptinotarsa decemlineata TaxID=7539 RepID=UPI003D30C3D1